VIVIVNCKAFEKGIGLNAVKLAKVCERVARKERTAIAIAVQHADISRVASAVKIPVLAQHVDAIEYGAHTGWVLPESVQSAGAVGSLINHSELGVPPEMIKKIVQRLRSLGMISVVCAANPVEEEHLAKFKPDMVAIEPPELIGGKVSVSQAKPEVISESVRRVKGVPVLCGAGVHTQEDVRKAVELGAQGILVASGVVNAKDPEKVLTELMRGLSRN